MKIKDQASWDNAVKINQDPYGAAVVRYAEKWADAMEAEIINGKSVAEVASKSSRSADTEGITGFMYGCAVEILARCWQHGEDLRRWHNIDTQIGSEGERANESGGVLNPALLNIGSKS